MQSHRLTLIPHLSKWHCTRFKPTIEDILHTLHCTAFTVDHIERIDKRTMVVYFAFAIARKCNKIAVFYFCIFWIMEAEIIVVTCSKCMDKAYRRTMRHNQDSLALIALVDGAHCFIDAGADLCQRLETGERFFIHVSTAIK